LERQRTHRTPPILRLEQNYGPEGIAMMAATILYVLSGAIVGLIGIALLLLSSDHGPLLTAGYSCMFAGMALEVPGFIRGTQGINAGRRFRGDRPFVKGPEVSGL
jgi:hypothetical protein